MFQPSRRDFLKRGSLLALSGGVLGSVVLRPALSQPRFVEAQTSFGRVRGIDVDGIKMFKGIPYGASTAGPNRFKPPADPARWSGVRDALDYGASAPQRDPGAARAADSGLSVASASLPPESEDCLVLNVWTPALDGAKRPVMLWCHGGGFATGSGSSPVTDGGNLARRGDVVVVSINHRLNVLGFTYLGELIGAGARAVRRRRHARHRARAANGCARTSRASAAIPGRVTVFGQSGGGRKVATLLAMPSAKGLFHRAIIESGATIKLVERDQAARVARELAAALELGQDHRCTICRPCRSTGSCARTSRPCAA